MLNFDIKKNKCFFCEENPELQKKCWIYLSKNQYTKLNYSINDFLIIKVIDTHYQKKISIQEGSEAEQEQFPPLMLRFYTIIFCNIFYTLSSPLWCVFCLFSHNATGNLLVCPWTLVWYISMTFLDSLGQRVCTFCWWVLPNFLPETLLWFIISPVVFENALFFTFLSS